jgi:hypothetical protein
MRFQPESRFHLISIAYLRAVSLFTLMTAALGQDSVCARVKLEILQELTLEREAFEARMTINNGLAGIPIEGVGVTVTFADAQGRAVRATGDSTDLSSTFFIRSQDGYVLPSTVAGGGSAQMRWLIIPARGAAGTDGLGATYYVGATLRYRVGGVEQVVEVSPDDILVKPMPFLSLDYFIPEEVYGDDPFTTAVVEPPIPFGLGVRVKNEGLGVARKLKIDSAQPRIVENRQGLAVDFRLVGSEVNGAVALPTLLADFGNIAPGRSGVARWRMISSLSGRFVEFNAFYTHADELGGALTSLINGNPRTHFLVGEVQVDFAGRDSVRDFLARDGDFLRVYESDGGDAPVLDASAASRVVGEGGRYRIQVPAQAGLFFVRVPDPFAGRQVLRGVMRSDGRRLLGPNAWLSQTWRSSARRWDYFVNLFEVGNPAGAEYVLEWRDAAGASNRPPRLDVPRNWTLKPGERLTFPLTASDPDGDRLVYRLEGDATGSATVDPDGTFRWEPGRVPVPSTHRLTATVTDSGLPALSDRQAFTVTVREDGASQPPVVTLSTNGFGYLEGSGPVLMDPAARISDLDSPALGGGRLSVTVIEGGTLADRLWMVGPSSQQTNLTVAAGGIVSYRGDRIGVLAPDGGGTNLLRMELEAAATPSAVQEVLRWLTFENRDLRGPSPRRVVQFGLTDGAGGVSTPVDLAILISPYNRAPVAVDDEALTTADVPIALLISKLVGNDPDADGDRLTFELLDGVTEQRGTVDVVGQAVVYVPDPALVGADSFRYRVTDPYGGWAEGVVRVTVQAPTSGVRTIVSVTPGGQGAVTVRFIGIPGRRYQLQWSEDLLFWSRLSEVMAGANGGIEFTDPQADSSRRFYRIVQP